MTDIFVAARRHQLVAGRPGGHPCDTTADAGSSNSPEGLSAGQRLAWAVAGAVFSFALWLGFQLI
jgi:hypothetical protein